MMGTERFYCVSCHALKPKETGMMLFKTGYFRIVHPLGCCEACRVEDAVKSYALPDAEIARKPDDPAASGFDMLHWAVV